MRRLDPMALYLLILFIPFVSQTKRMKPHILTLTLWLKNLSGINKIAAVHAGGEKSDHGNHGKSAVKESSTSIIRNRNARNSLMNRSRSSMS